MKGLFYKRLSGTVPYKAYYSGGLYGLTAQQSAGMTHNTLYAIPFPSGDGGAVDELATWICTTVAFSSLLRLAFYASTPTNDYPTSKVASSEVELDIAAGDGGAGLLTIGAISAALAPDALYFIVALTNTDRNGASFRSDVNLWPYFGLYDGVVSGTILKKSAFTYDILPDPFPTGAVRTDNGGPIPLIAAHFA